MINEKTARMFVASGDEFVISLNGEKKILKIVKDEFGINPRVDWDNPDHLFCWHSKYSLGDEHKHESHFDFIKDMLIHHISKEELLKAVSTEGYMIYVRYDRIAKAYEILTKKDGIYDTEDVFDPADVKSKRFVDYVLDWLSLNEQLKLLENSDEIAMLPVYLMDHGMISMSTSSFGDPWDSGQVGFIWADKKTIIGEGIGADIDGSGNIVTANEENWKQVAIEVMKSDVAIYDQYLGGNCYGYEIYDMDEDGDTEGDVIDSCYGFIGSTYEECGILDEFEVEEAA